MSEAGLENTKVISLEPVAPSLLTEAPFPSVTSLIRVSGVVVSIAMLTVDEGPDSIQSFAAKQTSDVADRSWVPSCSDMGMDHEPSVATKVTALGMGTWLLSYRVICSFGGPVPVTVRLWVLNV